ncbi:MAG: hypothetical protein ACRDQZ_02210 [Mycobacteriales bacterium]
MWFSIRLSRHLRLGVPWWIAILVAPFIILGVAALLTFDIVVWLLTGAVGLIATLVETIRDR